MPYPYLHFQGHCADAMAFYADVFGGELTIMKWSDAPAETPQKIDSDRVMHSHLALPDGTRLMAGDFPPGFEGDPQKAVSISHVVSDAGEGRALYDRLAEGGDVIEPFGDTFFSPGFGMVRDRYGTHWMIMTEA